MGRSRRLSLPVLAACGLASSCSPEHAEGPADFGPTEIVRFEGDVQLQNGLPLRYAAILAPDPGAPGGYLGSIDIPKQATVGAPLEQVRYQRAQHVEFVLAVAGAPHWVGHINADGSIECQFSQGNINLPCSMREASVRPFVAPEPPRRAQTPQPPFPYVTLDVKYENAEAHLLQAGTLTLPNGPGPHPAVLLISDVGTQDRDATLFRHKPFLVLADHLARAGIAALRVDDRGVGGSPAGAPGAVAADLEGDVRAGLGFLRARREIDARRVGLLGHGLGATLAARVAAGNPGVAFVVLLAPNAVSGRELFASERRFEALSAGAAEADAARAYRVALATIEQVISEPDPARLRQRLMAPLDEPTGSTADVLPRQELENLLELAATPGFRDFLRDAPGPSFGAVSCPLLVLGGALDREVAPAQNGPALRAALARSPGAELDSLPGLNHRFQHAETGAPSEYDGIRETLAPELLGRVSSWIAAVKPR